MYVFILLTVSSEEKFLTFGKIQIYNFFFSFIDYAFEVT